MKINQKLFDKIAEVCPGGGEIQISLFEISSVAGIKKLNLESLTPAERKKKLEILAKENRFVAVIQKADVVFAHVHEEHRERLQNAGALTMNNKVITWHGLSSENYDEEMSLILEVFLEALEKEMNPEEEALESGHSASSTNAVNVARDGKMPLRKPTNAFVLEMKAKQGEHLTENMRHLSERRREERRLEEIEIRREDITRREIQKKVKNDQVIGENVNRNELQQDIIAEDASSKEKRKKV